MSDGFHAAAGSSPADPETAANGKVGTGGVELLTVASPFKEARLSAKLAVSVLGLEAVGWGKTGPLLRFFCVEWADTKGGLDCDLLPCCAASVVVCLSGAAALMGTSLRPLGGREGQNLALCLVGGGDKFTGGSRRENEDEEPMTVWASVGWRKERRRPRKRRDMGAMIWL